MLRGKRVDLSKERSSLDGEGRNRGQRGGWMRSCEAVGLAKQEWPDGRRGSALHLLFGRGRIGLAKRGIKASLLRLFARRNHMPVMEPNARQRNAPRNRRKALVNFILPTRRGAKTKETARPIEVNPPRKRADEMAQVAVHCVNALGKAIEQCRHSRERSPMNLVGVNNQSPAVGKLGRRRVNACVPCCCEIRELRPYDGEPGLACKSGVRNGRRVGSLYVAGSIIDNGVCADARNRLQRTPKKCLRFCADDHVGDDVITCHAKRTIAREPCAPPCQPNPQRDIRTADRKVGERKRRKTSAMSLRVGVDAWNLLGDRRGIGRYVRELVRCWRAFGTERIRPTLLVPERATFLAKSKYLREIGVEMPVRYRHLKQDLDVVWYPWNGVSWVASLPMVATLHDASLFAAPPDDPLVREREQRPFRVAAVQARRIVTDSEFSKKELVRYLEVDADRVDVIYLGVSATFARDETQSATEALRYLLFVGEPERRKGLPVLLEAIAQLPTNLRESLELVVAGARGQYPLPATPESVRVRTVGWVDDVTLASLYRHALALVYPSEYEGFGLPILEAMAVGTPVIASDTPSSREAGGSAALYVPTSDAAALAAAIGSVASAPTLVEDLRRRGQDHAAGWTWERTAQQTLTVLERALAV